ncbi:MAG: hypothetical protein ACK4F6_18250, partial [Hylemonella sp.]
MFFKQLATKEASLSYFFGCATAAKAVAVDVVAGDEPWFIEEAKKAGVWGTPMMGTPRPPPPPTRRRQPGPKQGAPPSRPAA